MTNNFLRYWAPLCLYAGVIFYFSGISRPLPDVSVPFFDKALHICEYAVFGFLAGRAFKNGAGGGLQQYFKIAAVLVSILYGLSDEFHQSFVAMRQFSIFDIIADGIGGVVGIVVYGRYNPV